MGGAAGEGEGGAPVAGAGGAAGGASDMPCEAELPTGFCFVSDAEHAVAQGRTIEISGSDGQIEATTQTGAQLFIQAAQTGQSSWSALFGPPSDTYLDPGSYQQTAEEFGSAVLGFDGDGRSCDNEEGEFFVTEIESDGYGNIVRFAATFNHRCNDAAPEVRGAINFNANGVADDPPNNPADCTVATPIGVCYSSQGGHPEGEGLRVSLDPALATFNVQNTGTELVFEIDPSEQVGSRSMLNFVLSAPVGAELTTDVYSGVGVTATALQGKFDTLGCDDLEGSFEVLALEYASDGAGGAGGAGGAAGAGGAGGPAPIPELVRADVDFNYQCGTGDQPQLHGKLRYTRP